MPMAFKDWFPLATQQFFLQGAVALLLGLLIGTEREHSRREGMHGFWAGVRTFPLFSLLGFLAASLGGQLLLVAMGAFALMIAVAYVVNSQRGGTGMTTEAAALVTFLLGALVGVGRVLESAGAAVAVVILLSLKIPLHAFAHAMQEKDLFAVLKFATLAVLILPLLPNRTFGPYEFLNPFWFGSLVVILSGVSFAGYVLMKFFGQKRGLAFAGIIGGVASSTMVAIAMARRSREEGAPGGLLAGSVVLASIVMAVRLFVIAAAVAPVIAIPLLLPVGFMLVAGLLAWMVLGRSQGSKAAPAIPLGNPFELGPALGFAVVFLAVLLATRVANEELGRGALAFVTVISSLPSTDAISVSLADMAAKGTLAAQTAVAGLAIAAITNMVFKGLLGAWMGSSAFRRAWLPACAFMVLAAAAGAGAAWFLLR